MSESESSEFGPVFSDPAYDQHEQVLFCSDRDSGLRAIIAIHSTKLGPALGGCRMWPYNNEREAITDVLCLSHAMSYKNALAQLSAGGGKSVTELTVEDWQRTLGVNTIGVFLAVKHTVPHFVKQGSGAIVCTASVAALRANAGGVDYSASKAGVVSIVQTTAYQTYGTGVRINAICPGLIETGMTKPTFDLAREKGKEEKIGQINPTKRFGEPSEVGEMACFLLSDRASYVNGQAVPVDGGLSASHPWVFPRN